MSEWTTNVEANFEEEFSSAGLEGEDAFDIETAFVDDRTEVEVVRFEDVFVVFDILLNTCEADLKDLIAFRGFLRLEIALLEGGLSGRRILCGDPTQLQVNGDEMGGGDVGEDVREERVEGGLMDVHLSVDLIGFDGDGVSDVIG